MYAPMSMNAINETLDKAAAQERAEAKLRIVDLIARRKWPEAANVITAYHKRGTLTKEQAAAYMKQICVEEVAEKN